MALRLIQLRDADGERRLAAGRDDGSARFVPGFDTSYSLARAAAAASATLAAMVEAQGDGEEADVGAALAQGRVLAPVDHPDPAHLLMTGTGLTHLGSAEGRDQMHRAAAAGATLTDSMRMFLMGVEGGKPAEGADGAQPEWFYKGDGSMLVGPGAPLTSPAFALDGGRSRRSPAST